MKRRGCIDCRLMEPEPGAWVNNLCLSCTDLRARRAAETAAEPAPSKPVKRDPTADRLRAYLTNMASQIPDVWKSVDKLRALNGTGTLPPWPSWCFLPIAGTYAIVSKGGELAPEQLPQVGALAALAAWRVTQGIYRYDETVLDALWDTPVTGDIPEQVLMSLPEWCVYIETPGREFQGKPMAGFFCHLEHDANDKRRELRLIADTEAGLLGCMPVHLGAGLLAGLDRAYDESRKQVLLRGGANWLAPEAQEMLKTEASRMADMLAPMVSVLLYLCSANAEMRSNRRPRPCRPASTRTKAGDRTFAPDQPTVWEVGYRIGATIRAAREEEKRRRSGDGTHASPRPHIRRSHWHSFWTGEKAKPGTMRGGERKLVLKWLPPIPVNVEDESPVVPTIHRVTK